MMDVRLLVLLGMLVPVSRSSADTITYIDEAGATISMEARLLGSGQGFQALERRDGQVQLVANGGIRERQVTGDPQPVTYDEMADLLKQLFGEELVRIDVDRPFLVALVLASPLEKSEEGRVSAFLKKAGRFMKSVDSVFMKYAQSMRFPLRDLRYPLVLVIFESDDDFNAYALDATGGRGLSAAAIAGFYSGLTNWLTVRLTSCDTFEVPLHEAIHQQMYNRVFQRLAPIPKWFDEGIATGFESNGERIDVHPAKVNARYAQQASRLTGAIDWQTVVADDGAFTADVLAGDAYTLAWCMHWMLATQHKETYRDYVRDLSERKPLSRLADEERIQRFEDIFGVSIGEIQADFPRALKASLKRQRVNLAQADRARRAGQQQALGEVQIQAVRSAVNGRLQAEGVLRNVSPLRSMTFYVTVEASSGVYADWLVSDLRPGQSRKLQRQLAAKIIPGSRGGSADTYRVWVRSAPADSREAQSWKNGDLPGPIAGQ